MTTKWVTAAALQALAKQFSDQGWGLRSEFTANELADWTVGSLTADQRVHATTRLCALGFLNHRVGLIEGDRHDIYTVTPEGAAAIQAAASGQVRKSGPKTTRKGNPVNPDAFSTRLWNLLRIRKMLTPRQAAETLCDAGDDDFDTRRATARKCLRRWANAGALEESEKRIGAEGTSNGDKRYVLVKDSPTPPVWHKPRHGVRA